MTIKATMFLMGLLAIAALAGSYAENNGGQDGSRYLSAYDSLAWMPHSFNADISTEQTSLWLLHNPAQTIAWMPHSLYAYIATAQTSARLPHVASPTAQSFAWIPHASLPTAQTADIAHAQPSTWMPHPLNAAIAAAQDPTQAPQSYEPGVFEFFLNAQDEGNVFVYVSKGDVYVLTSDLEQFGLHGLSGRRVNIEGKEYVSLSSLAPLVTFKIDEESVALRVIAAAEFFPTSNENLRPVPPNGIVYSKTRSAFFNYSLNLSLFQQYSLFNEVGYSANGNLIYTSFARNANGTVVRDLTNLTIPNRKKLKTLTAGDFTATSNDPLGGNVLLGGVNYSRDFSLNPYFIHYPGYGLSGETLTPSTARVYVNGALVKQFDLPPGPFNLQNIPLTSGQGNTRIVIQDAFGDQHELNFPFYFSSQLLDPGMQDFSFNLGLQRNGLGNVSWGYNTLSFLGREKIGITKKLTAGLRLEGESKLYSFGPSIDLLLPFGELNLFAAVSRDSGMSGSAYFASYSHQSQKFSFGFTIERQSAHYANLSLPPLFDRPVSVSEAFLGIPPIKGIGDITLQFSDTEYRDSGKSSQFSITDNAQLSKKLSVSITASRIHPLFQKPTGSLFINLNYNLGGTADAIYSWQKQGAQTTRTVQLQESPPLGKGFGYTLLDTEGTGTAQQSALLQYQGQYGIYDLNSVLSGGQMSNTATIAGGLASIGGEIFASRPIEESFALVRVPDLKDVRIYLSNQEVGKTNSKGELLVPDLLQYYGNQIGIENEDIPVSYGIDAFTKIVAPPLRGGAVVPFPVYRLQIVIGRIIFEINSKALIPQYGECDITVGKRVFSSPLGTDADFYFENMPPGKHSGVVLYAGEEYPVTITVPESKTNVVDLGQLRFTFSKRGVQP